MTCPAPASSCDAARTNDWIIDSIASGREAYGDASVRPDAQKRQHEHGNLSGQIRRRERRENARDVMTRHRPSHVGEEVPTSETRWPGEAPIIAVLKARIRARAPQARCAGAFIRGIRRYMKGDHVHGRDHREGQELSGPLVCAAALSYCDERSQEYPSEYTDMATPTGPLSLRRMPRVFMPPPHPGVWMRHRTGQKASTLYLSAPGHDAAQLESIFKDKRPFVRDGWPVS